MSLSQTKPDSFTPLKPLPARGTIGIFAPSSPVEPEKLNQGITYLESLGYRTQTTPSCQARLHYLAGSGREKARDFMQLINDPNIDAIFCTRGGFGSIMMLAHLDYEAIRKARKILLGFSDVTALQWAIYARTGLPSISAGMVATDLAKPELVPQFEEYFWRLLHTGGLHVPLDYSSPRQQIITGISLPGTVSVGAMLLGTSYFPDLKGTIPILEDVNEQRHKVEAYLQQYRLGGHLDGLKALIFGRFTPAGEEEYPDIPSLDTVMDRAVEGKNYAVIKNFDYGHVPGKISLPVGVPISLSLAQQSYLQTRQSIFEI